MKSKIISILWLTTIMNVVAQIPAGYYDSAQGLSGYQLKTALKNIIDNHTVYSYDDLYDIYETTDTDNYYENDGTVLDMYSEKPTATDTYNYNHHQATCGQYSGEGDCYNREHIIPQSIFNSAAPMKSDAHFVVPTDGYVNNRRSSYPFGNVSGASWTSTNGSKLGSCANSGYSGTVFEPIDEFKGDIARMILYVATRYEDQIANWNSTDMFNGSSDQVFTDWFLQVLLNWHAQDPVSQREIDRNNAVYAYQNNRNPFIDHPEWVNQIWNPGTDTQAPAITGNLNICVFPNPLKNGQLNIQYEKMNLININLYDVTGKLLIQSKKEKHVISLKTLPQGIYYLQLTFDKGIMTQKLVIE